MKNTKINFSEFQEQIRIRTILYNTNINIDTNDLKFAYLCYNSLNTVDDTSDINEAFELMLDKKCKKYTRIRK